MTPMLDVEGGKCTEELQPKAATPTGTYSLAWRAVALSVGLAALVLVAFSDKASHLLDEVKAINNTTIQQLADPTMEPIADRRLGLFGGRRRRRRRKSAPAPAPAPDYSSMSYPQYISIAAGYCEDFGYETITNVDVCKDAGIYLSGDRSQDFDADMPSGGWTSSGSDRPMGCAHEGTESLNPLALNFFPNHWGVCGANNYPCLCSRPSSFSTEPLPYVIVRENRCESFGYERIASVDGCQAAGRYLARAQTATLTKIDGRDSSRPSGCTFHSSTGKSFGAGSELKYFSQGTYAGDCGIYNYDCICKLP